MTTPDIDTAHDNARLAHRRAYGQWRHSYKFTDAILRDDRRRDLAVFGYTPDQIRQIERELDAELGFSGS
jgi:hypothetical protein